MTNIMLKRLDTLDNLAKRYVWWESVDWSYAHPLVFLANVMNLGSWEDIQLLRAMIGDDSLIFVLKQAPPGSFSYRSWDYWHAKLGILPIPPLPTRIL